MTQQMECMCLQCGISHYLDRGDLALVADPGSGDQLLRDRSCEQCGGALMLRGRAEDEPCYKLQM